MSQQLISKTKIVMFTIIDGENEYLETLTMQSEGKDDREQAIQMIAEYYGIDDDDKGEISNHLNNDEMAMIGTRGIDDVYVEDPRTVNVYVRGGVIQDIQNIPPEIQIQVHDYDVEGMNNPDKDSEGIPCNISIWTTNVMHNNNKNP